MLELRPSYECHDRDLSDDSGGALICTFECTSCRDYITTRLGGQYPNYGGELLARSRRPRDVLVRQPTFNWRVAGPGGYPE